MTVDQTNKFIDWFKNIILAFENFFHQVQLWLDNDIYKAESGWFQNLLGAAASATETETEAE
jgi:hypothetical protein